MTRTNSGVPTPRIPPSEPRNMWRDDDDDEDDDLLRLDDAWMWFLRLWGVNLICVPKKRLGEPHLAGAVNASDDNASRSKSATAILIVVVKLDVRNIMVEWSRGWWWTRQTFSHRSYKCCNLPHFAELGVPYAVIRVLQYFNGIVAKTRYIWIVNTSSKLQRSGKRQDATRRRIVPTFYEFNTVLSLVQYNVIKFTRVFCTRYQVQYQVQYWYKYQQGIWEIHNRCTVCIPRWSVKDREADWRLRIFRSAHNKIS